MVVMMLGVMVWIGVGMLAALAVGRASSIGTDEPAEAPRSRLACCRRA